MLLTDQALAAMSERAQRQLDGMRVNRDVMARDVLQLIEALRAERVRRSNPQHGDDADGFARGDEPPRRVFRGATFDEALDKAFEAMDRDIGG